ncbi:hypothetical protein BGZ68_002687 [Mortierella alpina]|nr:hypothetical protein BGZ68_002687 [Mortierella alpina]
MKVSAAALVFAALASTVAAQMEYTTCMNQTSQAFQLTSVNWSPSPGCIGKELCAVGTGVLTEPLIAGAKLEVHGKWGAGHTVYMDRFDLCAVLAAQGTPCPIPAGPAVLKGCIKIKDNTPANNAVIFTTTAINGNNHLIFCTQGKNCSADTISQLLLTLQRRRMPHSKLLKTN